MKREFFLRPTFASSGSFVGQMIHLHLNNLLLCNLSLYLEDGEGRMFYSDQLRGPNLLHKKFINTSFSGTESYSFDRKIVAPNRTNYLFKVNTDFRETDRILAELTLSKDKCKNTADYEIEEKNEKEEKSQKKVHFISLYFALLTWFILYPYIWDSTGKFLFLLTFLVFFRTQFQIIINTVIIVTVIVHRYSPRNNVTLLMFIYASVTLSGEHLLTLAPFIILFSFKRDTKILFLCFLSDISLGLHIQFPLVTLITVYFHLAGEKSKYDKLWKWLLFIPAFVLIFIHFGEKDAYNWSDGESSLSISIEPYKDTVPLLGKTIDKLYEAAEKSGNVKNCKHCNFKPVGPVTSTDRDLVIVQIGGKPEKAKYSLFSLRATGCKAKVVVTLKPEEKLAKEYEEDLLNCGIIPVNLEKYHKSEKQVYMKIVRFPIYYEFLKKYSGKFDRILYFDSYDTVFQADPFISNMKADTLYVSSENHPINNSGYVKKWLKKIPRLDITPFLYKDNICSGAFSGDESTLIKLGEIMKALYRPGNNFVTNDQGLYNYLIYSGVFERAGISILKNKELATIGYHINEYVYPNLGNIHHKETGHAPALLHQINRDFDMEDVVFNACHIPIPLTRP